MKAAKKIISADATERPLETLNCNETQPYCVTELRLPRSYGDGKKLKPLPGGVRQEPDMKPANQADHSEPCHGRGRVLGAVARQAEEPQPNRGAPLFASPWLALMIILRKELMNSRRKH